MQWNADATSARISPEERERIVRGFEAWLDRALAEEEPPPGLTAELLTALEGGGPLPALEGIDAGNDGADLYSLWSAMTALSQEVKLQGRTFKQLNETLLRKVEAEAIALPQMDARQPRKQEIDALLDLRDRMERASKSAHSAAAELAPARLPWLARRFGVGGEYARHAQEIVAAIAQGYSLTLGSLDEALVGCNVSRILCQGCMFDPQRMTAVDVEETTSIPEGIVVEVYRNGYERNGEVYRSAQVKVARPVKER